MAKLKPPSRDEAPIVDHVLFVLGRAYFAYVGVLERILLAKGLAKHIRPGMGHVLFTLFEQDDRNISEISARAQLSPSTLTGLIRRMEKAGLVERLADPTDGRAARIRLSRLGRSLEPRCDEVMNSFTGLLAAGMGPAEVESLDSGLRRLLTLLRAAEG